jgi:uncharacterized membrane protein
VDVNRALVVPALALAAWTVGRASGRALLRAPVVRRVRRWLRRGLARSEPRVTLPADVRWKADRAYPPAVQSTVFYPVVLVAAWLPGSGGPDVGLAWACVATHVAHGALPAPVDRVEVRFALRSASSLALLALAARTGARLLEPWPERAMIPLVLAATFFVGLHPLVSGSPLRPRLVAALGEGRYRGAFSLLSLLGLVALLLAYRAAPHVPVWSPPSGLRPLGALLMVPSFVLVVLGATTPGPTTVARESLLRAPEPARGVLRVTRHPFLAGVAIWASVHLLVRGDAASILFFSAFLFLGLTGPARIDQRHRAAFGADWRRFEAATSVIPFRAILAGRNRFVPGEIGALRLGLALVLYALVLLAGHRLLFGVAPLG